MKKKLTKMLAMSLTVIMLCSAMALESFAAFDFLKGPIVESIAFSEDSCRYVSVKEMTSYYEEIDALVESFEKEFGDVSGLLGENSFLGGYVEDLYNFDLSMSSFDYSFVVTLSDGKTYTATAEDLFSIDVNFMYSIELSAYVTKEEYLKAKNKGAKTVKLDVKALVYSNILEDYTKDGEFSSKLSLKTKKSVVKSLTPVSGVPSKIYEDADYVDLSSAKFKISYTDGGTTTATVKQKKEIREDISFASVSYELDGNELYVWQDEDAKGNPVLTFTYLDAEYTKKITYNKPLFKSIKINSCDFDFEKGLTSITYTLNRTDGKSKKYTKEFSGEDMLNFYKVVDFVDGYYINVYMLTSEYDSTGEEEDLKLRIYVSAGETSSKPVEYDIPYSDTISTILQLIEKISEVIRVVTNFITSLLSSGEALVAA